MKSLEALVASYNANLVSLGSEKDEIHMNLGHKGVLDICSLASPAVHRVNLSSEPALTSKETSEKALDTLLEARGSGIGWLDISLRRESIDSKLFAPAVEDSAERLDGIHSACSNGAQLSISAQMQQLDHLQLQTLTLKADKVCQLSYFYLPLKVTIHTSCAVASFPLGHCAATAG